MHPQEKFYSENLRKTLSPKKFIVMGCLCLCLLAQYQQTKEVELYMFEGHGWGSGGIPPGNFRFYTLRN